MPNVAKIAWRFAAGDVDDIITTAHFHILDSLPEIELAQREDLALVAWGWWADAVDDWDSARSRFYNSIELRDVTVWTVAPSLSDATVYAPGALAGAAGANPDPLPPQVALKVMHRTLLEDRRGRGYMYLPAHLQIAGEFARGFIPDTARASVAWVAQNLAHRLRTFTIYASDGALAVYSRANADSRAVIGFKVADRLATQRRRAKRAVYETFDLVPPP